MFPRKSRAWLPGQGASFGDERIDALHWLVNHGPEQERQANIDAMARWLADYRASLTPAECASLNARFQTAEGRAVLARATARYNAQDVHYRGLTAPVISELLQTLNEYLTYTPGGGRVKHRRAANFVWNCGNGRFLYWFHNHGGRFIGELGAGGKGGCSPYDDRNPAWLMAGHEVRTPQGLRLAMNLPHVGRAGAGSGPRSARRTGQPCSESRPLCGGYVSTTGR